jgi:hypothetical protein
MATVGFLQREIGIRLGRGDSFSAVEADVIEPSGLPEEGKAALWLYGWSFLETGRARYERRLAQIRSQAGAPAATGGRIGNG